MASHWEVLFREVDDTDHHWINDSYCISPLIEDIGSTPKPRFDQAVFMDDCPPSGIFWMCKVVPTKIKMKVILSPWISGYGQTPGINIVCCT